MKAQVEQLMIYTPKVAGLILDITLNGTGNIFGGGNWCLLIPKIGFVVRNKNAH